MELRSQYDGTKTGRGLHRVQRSLVCNGWIDRPRGQEGRPENGGVLWPQTKLVRMLKFTFPL